MKKNWGKEYGGSKSLGSDSLAPILKLDLGFGCRSVTLKRTEDSGWSVLN